MQTAPGFDAARKLRTEVIEPLSRRFAGREELIELSALVLSASENLLIVGPPGTAKSQVVSEMASRITGRYFEYLLTRFTEPSEVFGPVDIRELREGRLVTRTEGMLPDAEIAFLDEVFNAGSAILNSLLGIINDGVFRRGAAVRKTGLISVLGATNRIPDEPSLRALEDRFTLRVECPLLEAEDLSSLLDRGWQIEGERLRGEHAPAGSTFSTADLRTIHAAVAGVDLGAVKDRLVDLIARIRAAGVFLSDRRAVKLQRLVAASAVLSGRAQAEASDLWPARHVWDAVEEKDLLEEIVGEAIAGEAAPADGGESATGGAGALEHPLAGGRGRPADLLEKARRIEAAVERLGAAPPLLAADEIHNRLQDIDAERRWCRARNPREEDELRELGARLDSIAALLARREGAGDG
jgi:MoxR-like ATPase